MQAIVLVEEFHVANLWCEPVQERAQVFLSFNGATVSTYTTLMGDEDDMIFEAIEGLEDAIQGEIYLEEDFSSISEVKQLQIKPEEHSIDDLVEILNNKSSYADLVLKMNTSTDTYKDRKYVYYKAYVPKKDILTLSASWYVALRDGDQILLRKHSKPVNSSPILSSLHNVTGGDGHVSRRFTLPSILREIHSFYMKILMDQVHFVLP